MSKLWVEQMMSIVTARLNIMAYRSNNMWISYPIAGGAYFYRRNWIGRFGYGKRHFPAFHLFLDIPAHARQMKCGIRLEDTHRNPTIQIPQSIQNIFPKRDNDSFRGHAKWVYDSCVVPISLPAGFLRNSTSQTLPLLLWVKIENQFFQAQQNCLDAFVNFN